MGDPPGAERRILVIHDVHELRELAQSVLKDEGFVVDLAPDTTLGALKLMAHKPDIVILDVSLPGVVDGFRFVEYVREVTQPPAVLFLSDNRSIEMVLRGVALGVIAFLPKPVNFTLLVEACRSALERKAAPAASSGGEHERRAHKRHSVLVQVQIVRETAPQDGAPSAGEDTAKGVVLGEMKDLSAGGASVIAVAKFPIGARVQIVPDAKVVRASKTLVAEIRTREEIETGFRYGLSFVDLDSEVEQLLTQHLAPVANG
jgi:DNA-binding NarL/FixJ family response regulator